MKIFDCFTYFDEKHLAEIRLNILKDYVDYFVICEAKENFKGVPKKLNFPLEKFKDIRHKIIYVILEKFPKLNSAWETQNYQRNYLINGLTNADKNDLILFSDADEIPNPKILQEYNRNYEDNVGIFIQKFFYYKLNLNVPSYSEWEGTRSCKKKNLRSFGWLRNETKIKNLKYGFWRIDKYKNIAKIVNGGWHFSFLGNADFIASKIKSYAHSEYDKEEYTNLDKINLRIKNMIDPFDRNKKLLKISIDSSYPDYIINNQDRYKDLIL
tara:strand:- start:70 stop:876 length:807 start_codon:yes stop_codon:yes gene_type:complete